MPAAPPGNVIANPQHATYLPVMKIYLNNPMVVVTLLRSALGSIAAAPVGGRMTNVLRGAMLTSALSLSLATGLQAEEDQPDWLPEEIELPEDREVLMDRAIGSTIRMFSMSTERDALELLEEWEDALREAGYTINQGQDDVLDETIEFSSDAIINAKIAILPTSDNGRSTIEFDVTLP